MRRGLDTYYGRRITNISVDVDGHWFVELEGEVRIINVDNRRTLPRGLPNEGIGLIFATQIMEQDKTQLVFRDDRDSEWRIALSPISYQILDTTVSEKAYAPQAGGYGKAIEVPDVVRPEEEEPEEEE